MRRMRPGDRVKFHYRATPMRPTLLQLLDERWLTIL